MHRFYMLSTRQQNDLIIVAFEYNGRIWYRWTLVKGCRFVLKSPTRTHDFVFNLPGEDNNDGDIQSLWASCNLRIEI